MTSSERLKRAVSASEMRDVFGDSDMDSDDGDEESDQTKENESRRGKADEVLSAKVLSGVGKRRQHHVRPPSSDESDLDDETEPKTRGRSGNNAGNKAKESADAAPTMRASRSRSGKNAGEAVGPQKRASRSQSGANRTTAELSATTRNRGKDKQASAGGDAKAKKHRRRPGPSSRKQRNTANSDDESAEDADDDEDGDDGDDSAERGKNGKLDDDDSDSSEEEEAEKVMERILAWRIKGQAAAKDDATDKGAAPTKAKDDGSVEYEYLIKWKRRAYIHCEWVSKDVVHAQPQGKARLQKYLRREEEKMALKDEDDEDADVEEPIPEDFCTVERILAVRVNDSTKKKQYLVKWRSVQYAEATWEYEEDVKDDSKIIEFHQRNEMPKAELLKTPPRPKPEDFSTQPNPKLKSGGELREYQLEGYNWLISCWFRRQGSILADEMGLGKTIQSVAFCHYLFSVQNIRGPFLVVAPLSTLGHWQREFETWTWLNALVYHGNVESRDVILKHEWTYPKQSNRRGPPYKWHVLVTTYETILQEASRLRGIKWNNIVVDEAHRLKNKSSKLIEELRSFSTQHRILLTGTPIQNTSLEVWSLLNFLDSAQFSDEAEFARKFCDVKDSNTVNLLKETLRPFLLRRLKEDVEKSIPPKEETIVSVELTRVQKKWYRALLEQNFAFLDKNTKSSSVGNLRNIVMELRKSCNHPYLIKGVEQIEMEANPPENEEATIKKLIDASGKLVLVDKLLPRLKEEGHKVLVFSQMIRVLDILEDYLIARRWGYERIDGHVRGNDRQQAIDRFSKPDSEKFVFLLCTRAGGQGINLTVADTVIIYDSDWNPQNDVQAQARCHRIGQKKDVKIYRLITRGTYEMDMFDKASKKLGLDQAVLQNMGLDNKSTSASAAASAQAAGGGDLLTDLKKEEVDHLLRRGAYDVFNEDDSAADAFTSEDISQILERRTTLVRSGGENQGPSAFSKATFDVTEKGTSVDVNDPDFWKKIMPNGPTAPDPNIQVLPRRRKQTVRYVPQEHDNSSGDEAENDSNPDEVISGESPSGRPLWSKEERKKLYKGLMSFGWGRWRDVAKFAGFGETRSIDEVAMVARNIVRQAMQNYASGGESEEDGGNAKSSLLDRFPILKHAQGPHRTIMDDDAQAEDEDAAAAAEATPEEDDVKERPWMSRANYREGAEIVEPLFVEPVLQKGEYTSFLTRNAAHIFDRLELLSALQMLDNVGELAHEKPVPTIGASGNQAIGDWWDENFDRDILKGTLSHGYGNYLAIRQDPSLLFLGRTEPVEDAGSPDDDADAAKRKSSAEDSNGTAPGDDADQKNGKADSGEDEPPRNRAAGEEAASKEDGDSDSTSKEKKDRAPVAHIPVDEMHAREWPSIHKVNSRIKKLIRAYVRQKKKLEKKLMAEQETERVRREKEQQRLAKLEEQRHERERKAYLLSITWTKKERQEFSRYYSHIGGAPLDETGEESWALVQARVKLTKKTPQIISDYARDYYRMCVQVVEADRTAASGKKPVAEEAPKPEDKSFTVGQLEDAKVSVSTAKRFHERHELLRELRAINLAAPLVEKNVRDHARRPKLDQLPAWWSDSAAKYDMELLKAVRVQGFDTCRIPAENETFKSACVQAAQAAAQASDGKEDPQLSSAETPKNGDDTVAGSGAENAGPSEVQHHFPFHRSIYSRVFHLVKVANMPEKPKKREPAPTIMSKGPPPPAPSEIRAAQAEARNARHDARQPRPDAAGNTAEGKAAVSKPVRIEPKPEPVEDANADAEVTEEPEEVVPSIASIRATLIDVGVIKMAPEEAKNVTEVLGKRKMPESGYHVGRLISVDGITSGEMVASFENVDCKRLSRNLLKALKKHKKANSAAVAQVALPDWKETDEAFHFSTVETAAVPSKNGKAKPQPKADPDKPKPPNRKRPPSVAGKASKAPKMTRPDIEPARSVAPAV